MLSTKSEQINNGRHLATDSTWVKDTFFRVRQVRAKGEAKFTNKAGLTAEAWYLKLGNCFEVQELPPG